MSTNSLALLRLTPCCSAKNSTCKPLPAPRGNNTTFLTELYDWLVHLPPLKLCWIDPTPIFLCLPVLSVFTSQGLIKWCTGLSGASSRQINVPASAFFNLGKMTLSHQSSAVIIFAVPRLLRGKRWVLRSAFASWAIDSSTGTFPSKLGRTDPRTASPLNL